MLRPGGMPVLLTIGIIALLVWIFGFLVFHIAGGLIHIALIIAAVLIIWHFVRGRAHAR